jgi:hypothetical protein
MVSLRWVFVSFPAGGETASRKREQPSQADLQARRVQNIAQLTASDPAAIATFRQSSSRSNDQRFQLPARTNRAGLMMSVHRGGPEGLVHSQNGANDP